MTRSKLPILPIPVLPKPYKRDLEALKMKAESEKSVTIKLDDAKSVLFNTTGLRGAAALFLSRNL